jgi:hypothetical protein
MAGAYAIAAVGQAILSLLENECPKADFSGAEFKLFQAADFKNPMDEGVALFLHRVTPANNVRNMPPRVGPDGVRFRPSLPIDLHYLLIAYAPNAVKQQRLLGWAMRAIEDHPLFDAGRLNDPGPEKNIFADHEAVDVIMETLSILDAGSIWEVAKPAIQPAVPYVVRMLMLDSARTLTEADLVQTRVFAMGEVRS